MGAHPSPEADVLVLDAHTLKDLEIFSSANQEICLYQFCNLTQTYGGAAVLRRRMEIPSSNAVSILATQEAIAFIIENRQVFEQLPAAYTISRVEHYSREVMPMVTQDNALEFGIAAFTLWANHDSYYISIVHGVQFTCTMIQGLRQFVSHVDFTAPMGELSALIEELRTLLGRPRFALVPNQEMGSWVWQILRLDQVFRIHEKAAINRILQISFEIDALLAMADVTSENDYVIPQIKEGPLSVQADGLIHPFVHKPVANPVELNQQQRILFLTGPNMAGKTTYLRAFAIALYMAHLGMGVPAKKFNFVPAQRLFSSISLNDDLSSGVSYFRAEALRVKAVAMAIAEGYRVVSVMDEPFKGTNVKDALDASRAILERLTTKQDCLFMFSSHLIELNDQLSSVEQIDCRYFRADEGEGRLSFDYLIRSGVSNQRLGMRVLQEEGVFELLDNNPG